MSETKKAPAASDAFVPFEPNEVKLTPIFDQPHKIPRLKYSRGEKWGGNSVEMQAFPLCCGWHIISHMYTLSDADFLAEACASSLQHLGMTTAWLTTTTATNGTQANILKKVGFKKLQEFDNHRYGGQHDVTLWQLHVRDLLDFTKGKPVGKWLESKFAGRSTRLKAKDKIGA